MPTKPKSSRITIEELASAIESEDWLLVRFQMMKRYSKQKPSAEAIPLLCLALEDSYHGTVKCAAKSLRKLGPQAVDAINSLLAAAVKLDKFGMPQAYPHCVEAMAAMAAIAPRHPQLLSLIRHHSTRYNNWVPISYSLRALKTIGTDEANIVLREIAEFWEPELNKMQRRVVHQLLTDASK